MTKPLAWINRNILFLLYSTYVCYFCLLLLYFFFSSTYCFKKLSSANITILFHVLLSYCTTTVYKVWQWRVFMYTYFRLICSWINNFTIHFRFTKNSLSTWYIYGCVEKHYDENVNVNSHKRFSFTYKDSTRQSGVDSLMRNLSLLNHKQIPSHNIQIKNVEYTRDRTISLNRDSGKRFIRKT